MAARLETNSNLLKSVPVLPFLDSPEARKGSGEPKHGPQKTRQTQKQSTDYENTHAKKHRDFPSLRL